MKQTGATWFQNVCIFIVCIFFVQTGQPITFGFAPSRTSLPLKGQASTALVPKGHFENQVTQIVDRVKRQLQELEVVPEIDALTGPQSKENVSCGMPTLNTLPASTVADHTEVALKKQTQS